MRAATIIDERIEVRDHPDPAEAEERGPFDVLTPYE